MKDKLTEHIYSVGIEIEEKVNYLINKYLREYYLLPDKDN